jgi:hypothetical protein
MGREFLAAKDVCAETAEQARCAYCALWRAGQIELCGYDMIDYGVIELREKDGESDANH